jgi:hypothetical protein
MEVWSHGNTNSGTCQSVQRRRAGFKSHPTKSGAAPKRRPLVLPLSAGRQPVKRGAALWRGLAALHTLNDLRVVVTFPFESVAVMVSR